MKEISGSTFCFMEWTVQLLSCLVVRLMNAMWSCLLFFYYRSLLSVDVDFQLQGMKSLLIVFEVDV